MQPDEARRSARAAWRWLTKPAISIADGLLIATATLTADALKLAWHLPWPAVLAIVWGIVAVALFGVGFAKGFGRSALADYRQWRTTRGR